MRRARHRSQYRTFLTTIMLPALAVWTAVLVAFALLLNLL